MLKIYQSRFTLNRDKIISQEQSLISELIDFPVRARINHENKLRTLRSVFINDFSEFELNELMKKIDFTNLFSTN